MENYISIKLYITITFFKRVFFITQTIVPVSHSLGNQTQINVSVFISQVRSLKAPLNHSSSRDFTNHSIEIP